MPREIPKSPVQHLRHRVSGFSIPGRLPCLLAVVLGLFAHHEALAQTNPDPLTSLELTDTDDTSPVSIVLAPALTADPTARSFTASVLFGVTQVTVNAMTDNTWTLTYQGAADADGAADLRLGSNTITVRATKTGETTQNYTIRVTRDAEIGSALSDLSILPADIMLNPTFPPADPTARTSASTGPTSRSVSLR